MRPVAEDERSRRPRLLALGAGPASLGLLEAARAQGIWTAVCDRDPAAPGFPLASQRCIVPTDDEPTIERLAAALRLDGVIAPGSDRPVGVAARVAAKLGLAHPLQPVTAAIVSNRLRLRACLAAAGVPQPRWEAVAGDPGELGPPCVVKTPEQSHRDVILALDDRELAEAVEDARLDSRNGVVLVEELVEGPELTVVGYCVDNGLIPLAVADRTSAEPPAFGVALQHVWPSSLGELALEVARRAVEAVGIEHGPVVVQLRVSRGGPEVIGLSARLGGAHEAELVHAATGIDLHALALAAAVGGRPTAGDVVSGWEPRAGSAVTRFLVAPPGVLESVELPQGLPGLVSARVYREPGHVFGPLRRASDRAGAVLVVGATRGEALARADVAAERIRFATVDAGVLV
jgi:biotin carboxylase